MVRTMSETKNRSEGSIATRVPESGLLDEIVRRIVEVAAPDSIILFGSAARGEWSPDSDIDLLVVKPRDIESFRDKIGTVINPALAEGKTICAAFRKLLPSPNS